VIFRVVVLLPTLTDTLVETMFDYWLGRRDLVIALRDQAGLAWGAVDFGTRESGDVMHFDARRDGIGRTLNNS